MKKVLVLCVALALYATSAFAAGADLTYAACPGNAGATDQATGFDCSTGDILSFYGVFQPVEAMPDLVSISAIMDIAVNGDLGTNAGFWDFENNSSGLILSHARPTAGCAGYVATWSPNGSGEAIAFRRQSPSNLRMGIVCYRPTNLSTTANQKLYGFNIAFDGSTSAEFNGGVGPLGCGTVQSTMLLQEVFPTTASGSATTSLVVGASATNCVQIGSAATAGAPS
jgi:hypothetical protein